MSPAKTDVARQSLSIATLLLLLVAVTAMLRACVAPWPAEAQLPEGVLLGAVFQEWMAGLPLLAVAVNLGLLLVCAFHITRIATLNMLYVSRTFLPIVFYAVTALAVYATPTDVTGMLCSLLFIRSSHLFVASFRRTFGFGPLLLGGLLAGLLPLLLPAAVVVWAAVPAALVLFRRSWRESVVCAVGLLLPLALCSYVYWIGGESFSYATGQIVDALVKRGPAEPMAVGVGQLVLQCLLTLLVFVSVGAFAGTTMRTRPSRIFRYFICTAVIAAAGFLLPCRSVQLYPLLAPSIALLAPFYFVRRRGTVPALVYIVIVACAVVINLLPLL